MNTPSDKPAVAREFWVNDTGQPRYSEAYRKPLMDEYCVHVIEYSAYENLQAQLEIALEVVSNMSCECSRATSQSEAIVCEKHEALDEIAKLKELK